MSYNVLGKLGLKEEYMRYDHKLNATKSKRKVKKIILKEFKEKLLEPWLEDDFDKI